VTDGVDQACSAGRAPNSRYAQNGRDGGPHTAGGQFQDFDWLSPASLRSFFRRRGDPATIVPERLSFCGRRLRAASFKDLKLCPLPPLTGATLAHELATRPGVIIMCAAMLAGLSFGWSAPRSPALGFFLLDPIPRTRLGSRRMLLAGSSPCSLFGARPRSQCRDRRPLTAPCFARRRRHHVCARAGADGANAVAPRHVWSFRPACSWASAFGNAPSLVLARVRQAVARTVAFAAVVAGPGPPARAGVSVLPPLASLLKDAYGLAEARLTIFAGCVLSCCLLSLALRTGA